MTYQHEPKKSKPSATHPVLFVGAGPGDPELITVKGRCALEKADAVIYAGSLVPEAVLRWARPEAEKINSAGLDLDGIIRRMADFHQKGLKVVRLHTGDPSLYGAIYEQMRELDKHGIDYRIIPGVTAAFAAAAALSIEYTLPEITQTLILTRLSGRTPVPQSESLSSLAAHGSSMVVYLSVAMIEEVVAILGQAYGADSPCAVVFRASHPDEKIIFCHIAALPEKVREEKIDRQAVIVVGPALAAKKDLSGPYSRLYDKTFSHGFRKEAGHD